METTQRPSANFSLALRSPSQPCSSFLCRMTVLLCLLSAPLHLPAQETVPPTTEDFAAWLEREPVSLETWSTWRDRLVPYLSSYQNDRDPPAALEAATQFVRSQLYGQGGLTEPLANDFFAQFLVANLIFHEPGHLNLHSRSLRAEKPLRRSIQLNDTFAPAHLLLARSLLVHRKDAEAEVHFDKAAELAPELSQHPMRASAAYANGQYQQAYAAYRLALADYPESTHYAFGIAMSLVFLVSEDTTVDAMSALNEIDALLERFPDEGRLHISAADILAHIKAYEAAAKRLERARELGSDPNAILGDETVRIIDRRAGNHIRKWATYAVYISIGFAVIYGCVILAMVLAGIVLGNLTRGGNAVRLLSAPVPMMQAGQVARTDSESLLARLYVLFLTLGLIMFYVAIPFVILGMLVTTGALIHGIISTGFIPVQLLAIIVAFIGLGMAWNLARSVLTKPPGEDDGTPLDPTEYASLYQMVREVAEAVDTEPIHEIYFSPLTAIGVQQTGRGPFGVFGVRRRVLNIGMASLKHLTVQQLKSVLAHEYAHFSHGDTFYSRFIYQFSLSIDQSLTGMAHSIGTLNYVNPFYWFMLWYYRAFTMMAAGFFRSREFLADRMAASLYGRDTFTDGLLAVATDAAALEFAMHERLVKCVQAGQPVTNLYEDTTVADSSDSLPTAAEIQTQIMSTTASTFDSHPSLADRIEAISGFPKASSQDPTPATTLLPVESPLEEQLSQMFAVCAMYYVAYQQQPAG